MFIEMFVFYSFSAMIIMAYAIGGISAVVSFIVLPIPAVRHYFCLKLPKHQLHTLIWRCYLVWANIMLVTLIGHSAFILYYLNKILEYTNERFGWIFVTILLHVLTATVSERFSRTLPDAVYNTLFMFGVAGLPVINSVSLATELILQVYKGERTVDDLRVLVLPFESIMAGVWLILQICEYWVTKWRDVGKELYALRDFVAQFISQQGDIDESDNLSEICLSEIQRCQPEAAPFLEERELRRFKMS